MSRRRSDRGAVTLAAIGLLGVLLFVGAALAAVGGIVVAHREAQAAADLAAVAAAAAAGSGGDPCQAGSGIASANGGALVACSVQGREVVVEVRMAGPRWLGHGADPVATARAGPG